VPYAALDPSSHSVVNPTADDLARMAHEVAPARLLVVDYRLETLEPFAAFPGLESLKIQGGFKANDLSPLSGLRTLRELVLSTPPGSDGSGRVIDVHSLAPLAALASLERLVLIGVRPRDLDLAPLAGMKHLRELEISHVKEFTLEQYARLAAALPNTGGRTLTPHRTIPGVGLCRKCGGQQVLLNGAPPRARKWLCPKCQQKLIAAHVARWEAARAGL
jgi:hypothetical protein